MHASITEQAVQDLPAPACFPQLEWMALSSSSLVQTTNMALYTPFYGRLFKCTCPCLDGAGTLQGPPQGTALTAVKVDGMGM